MAAPARVVILSVDGLRGDLVTPALAPNMSSLAQRGACHGQCQRAQQAEKEARHYAFYRDAFAAARGTLLEVTDGGAYRRLFAGLSVAATALPAVLSSAQQPSSGGIRVARFATNPLVTGTRRPASIVATSIAVFDSSSESGR